MAFAGALTAFVLVIMILLTVLYIQMSNFERGLPEHELDRIIEELKNKNTAGIHFSAGGESGDGELFADDAFLGEFFSRKLSEAEPEYVRINSESTDDEAVYMIRNEVGNLLKVRLAKKSGELEKSHTEWEETESIIESEELAVQTLTIQVPADCPVKIGGIEVPYEYKMRAYITPGVLDNLAGAGIIHEQPYMDEYVVRGIFYDPQVTVTDHDGQEKSCRLTGGIYVGGFEADEGFVQEQTQRIMDMMESYGRYFSGDAPASVPGEIMLNDSPAIAYAKNVDISWMQAHDRAEITDKQAGNFRKYSDECYSCDIRFVETIYKDGEPAKTWDTNMTWIMVRDGDYFIADIITRTAEE